MTLRAIGLTLEPNNHDFDLRPGEWSSAEALLTKLRETRSLTVCLLGRSDLPDVKAHSGLIVDCGTKDERKPLSRYVLGKSGKIPVIDGGYRSSRQVARSARDLLRNASMEGERNSYIVGTPAGIFEDLWEKAQAASRTLVSRGQERAPEWARHLEEEAQQTPAQLLELLTPRAVPPWLRRSYFGESPRAELVRQLIVRAAGAVIVDRRGQTRPSPVLILGETGTGKELVATAIHGCGPNRDKPFVPVNCGAIPQDLLESELFGHLQGAFTGATSDKEGLWKAAGDGTLFLDEIGELSAGHQAKVLRALQEHRIRPLGARKEEDAPARVIAATNRDLVELVQSGRFRVDLYYRLCVFVILTPALRDRAEDIAGLAQLVWRRLTRDDQRRLPERIVQELQSHTWPGNVNEFENTLAKLYSFFAGDVADSQLAAKHLEAVMETPLAENASARATEADVSAERGLARHRLECLRHLRRADEALRSCKVLLRPILREHPADQAKLTAIRDALRERLVELDWLCRQPLLFHSEPTFLAVARARGRLSRFDKLLDKDARAAVDYWKSQAAADFKGATSALFQEVTELLKASSTPPRRG